MPLILWPALAWYMFVAAITGHRRERTERET